MSEQAATTASGQETVPEMDLPPEAEMSEESPQQDQVPEDPARPGDDTESGYRNAEFENLETTDVDAEGIEPNLDVILNIPVTLSMQIGRTQMTIEELMRLNRGSVVKLDRMAGEPMDVLVNGTLIAHGEVVVVNDKFGIRLLDVISPAERVKKLS
ncbi:flagellar motor switch protein FliN [Thiolapillus sp.]